MVAIAVSILGVYLLFLVTVFIAIQLIEQWRSTQKEAEKQWLLLGSSISFGGCTIWAMHFTSMDARTLCTTAGSSLEVHFEGYASIFSLALAISSIYGGLKLASRDSFHETLATDGKVQSYSFVVAGGIFAGLGVFGMHYCSMWAQRTNIQMSQILWLLLLSIGISCAAVTSAFYFLFRILAYYPKNLTVRMISALIIGLAVCGINFCILSTAVYTITSAEESIVGFLLSSSDAAVAASHGSLILCYTLCAVGVLQNDHEQGDTEKNKAKVHVGTD